ncbi:CcdB family protein [Inquilinus sp. CAU 1745]|uniref:CcdB family protein n=1 Tax=Inquilinus sp. CAU 1745 TaxID=3140369 RepID=UPI00325B5C8B
MARFDVYANPDGLGYLLDIQAGFLSHLTTRVVVPLLPLEHAPMPAKGLNPRFRIGDEEVLMATQFMAAVPNSTIKNPVATLNHRHHEIVDAIDLLMQGF